MAHVRVMTLDALARSQSHEYHRGAQADALRLSAADVAHEKADCVACVQGVIDKFMA